MKRLQYINTDIIVDVSACGKRKLKGKWEKSRGLFVTSDATIRNVDPKKKKGYYLTDDNELFEMPQLRIELCTGYGRTYYFKSFDKAKSAVMEIINHEGFINETEITQYQE